MDGSSIVFSDFHRNLSSSDAWFHRCTCRTFSVIRKSQSPFVKRGKSKRKQQPTLLWRSSIWAVYALVVHIFCVLFLRYVSNKTLIPSFYFWCYRPIRCNNIVHLFHRRTSKMQTRKSEYKRIWNLQHQHVRSSSFQLHFSFSVANVVSFPWLDIGDKLHSFKFVLSNK